MERVECSLSYTPKTAEFSPDPHLTLGENLLFHEIQEEIVNIYKNVDQYAYIICPLFQYSSEKNKAIVAHSWGKQMSFLSIAEIQSYAHQSWLATILRAFCELSFIRPIITKQEVFIKNNEEPKFLPTYCCEMGQYVENFKKLVGQIFQNAPKIVERNTSISQLKDIQAWLEDLKLQKQGKTIQKLLQLKNSSVIEKQSCRIAVKQEELKWILSFTTCQDINKFDLIYDGEIHQFDPTPLLKIIQKEKLLFLLETKAGKKVAFWMNAQPEINKNALFGRYYPDKTKQSVLLGLEKRSVHRLLDENNCVGFGNELLLSIGYTDIVLSAFNCSNISYFPCSYSGDEQTGVNTAENLLGKEFVLRQLQVYKIK